MKLRDIHENHNFKELISICNEGLAKELTKTKRWFMLFVHPVLFLLDEFESYEMGTNTFIDQLIVGNNPLFFVILTSRNILALDKIRSHMNVERTMEGYAQYNPSSERLRHILQTRQVFFL